MRFSYTVALCLCTGALGACAPSIREAPPGVSAAPPVGEVPAPQVLREKGLESVIGKGARALRQRFGKARIDLSEGDARKLQFSSDACVLDVFLYPLERGRPPVATHVEARRRVGGGNTDRARCIDEVARGGRGS